MVGLFFIFIVKFYSNWQNNKRGYLYLYGEDLHAICCCEGENIMTLKDRLNLFKLTGEVRYNPAILFNDLQTLNKINKRMNDQGLIFSQTNPDGSLACIDPENKAVLVITNQIANFTIDQPKGFDRFNSKIAQIIPDVLNILDIDKSQRIGVRAQWMLPFDSEDQASEHLIKSGLSNNISSTFPEAELPGITLVCKNTDNKQINIGIRVETHQVIQIIQNVTRENYTVTGIVIDVDIFDQTSTTKTTQINSFVKNLNNQFEDYLSKALTILE